MKVPPAGLAPGRAIAAIPPFEEIRHYFFDMGRDGLLAFFEMPKGEKERGDRNAIGAMQHVSLAVSPDKPRKRICEAAQGPRSCRSTGRWKSCPASSRSMCSIQTTSGSNFPARPSNGERRAFDRAAGDADQRRGTGRAQDADRRQELARPARPAGLAD